MDLGCDPRGYSRAGSDTMVWYCVILAGRLSAELNKMREVNSLTLTMFDKLLDRYLKNNSAILFSCHLRRVY